MSYYSIEMNHYTYTDVICCVCVCERERCKLLNRCAEARMLHLLLCIHMISCSEEFNWFAYTGTEDACICLMITINVRYSSVWNISCTPR